MNHSLLVLALATISLASCLADINLKDYIFWKKADINTLHKFYASRSIQQEAETTSATNAAVYSLQFGLKEDLSKIVAFQYRELEMAKQLMADTDAEGCINGISNFLDQAISDIVDSFQDCTADVPSKLSRMNYSLARQNYTYQSAYQRALAGIDSCTRTYPNKDSIGRLKSCIESMNNNYITSVNNIRNALNPSPSMTYFRETVVSCVTNAANEVVTKGKQFLKMLLNCAGLSGGTKDFYMYAAELSKWKGYNVTLADQIAASQSNNFYQISRIENDMNMYYSIQKQAVEYYVLESRGLGFYLNKIYSYLSDYYNTVTATSLDNPGDTECITAAKTALDNVAREGAATSLDRDLKIVNDTKSRIADIYNNFDFINTLIPSFGNVVLMNCISKGYALAPNTIWECNKLVSDDFSLKYYDRYATSSQDLSKLFEYVSTFFSNDNFPCGCNGVDKLKLGGETVLYDLKRCLYKSSGSTYDVTTPLPYTTTDPSTYTTD